MVTGVSLSDHVCRQCFCLTLMASVNSVKKNLPVTLQIVDEESRNIFFGNIVL